MTSYEIKIEVETKHVLDMMSCMFWFNNPLSGKRELFSQCREDGESSMRFIERVKEYINSKLFINDLRDKIKEGYRKHNDENEMKKDYNEIKRELDGMTFTVNVKIDD